jgi:hypothetical protein
VADDAFAPPEEEAHEPSATATALVWGAAGAVIGTAGGTLAQLTGGPGAVGVAAAAGGAVLALAGFAVGVGDAARARGRPALRDHQGRLIRRGDAWVRLVPLAASVGALGALVVLATVQQESPLAGVGFAVAAAGLTALAPILLARARTARGLEHLARGDAAMAREALSDLAAALWCPPTPRAQAHLFLAVLDLRDGDVNAARTRYERADRGRVRPSARLGRALVAVVDGRYDEAAGWLVDAQSGGRSLQREIDGVRLLLVLRRDGPAAARDFGRRLLGPDSGPLFRGALAVALQQVGEAEAAFDLADDALRRSLVEAGLGVALPELQA